jgi:hypothetical protein
VVAIVVQVVLMAASALLLLGYTSQLTTAFRKANVKLGTTHNKDFKNPYTAADIAHDLHSYRVSIIESAVLFGFLFILCAFAIYAGRGGLRWVYTIIALFTQIASNLFALSGDGPKLTGALSFLGAIVGLVAIVLLVLPSSSKFFAVAKAQRAGPPLVGADGAAVVRPAGLRGLFMPPPPRHTGTGPGVKPGRTSNRKPAATRPVTRPVGKAAGVEPIDPISLAVPAAPAGGASGRGKPKTRTGGLESVGGPSTERPSTSTATTTPTAPVAARAARGKSRRG